MAATYASMEDAINRVKVVFMAYMGGPICVIGIITSALSLALFKRDKSTTVSTRLILSMVAVTDIFFLAFMFFFWAVKRSLPHKSAAYYFFENPFCYALLFYGSNVCELYRNWLVVVIAVERLLFFIKPIEFKVLWSYKRVLALVIAIGMSSFVIRIPVLIYAYTKQANQANSDLCRLTNLMHTIIDCVFLNLVPLTLMFVISVVTTVQLRAVMKTKMRLTATLTVQGNKDEDKSRKHNRIIKILHTVLITFIVCSIPCAPAAIMSFYVVFHKIEGTKLNLVLSVISSLANFGSLLNSTSNFFVYVAQSKRYQYILVNILYLDRCFKSLKRETSSSGHDNECS